MPSRDPRVDAYIKKSAPFARPILEQLREFVHGECPDVEETIKWGMPSFTYHGILCGMAAFKEHATFGFWRGSVVGEANKNAEAMGQLGRLSSVKDLPPKQVMKGWIKEAMRINIAGIKPAKPRKRKPELAVPDDLAGALQRNKKARTTFFDTFSPSHRREYIEWIVEAKREETRQKRLAQTIEWLAEGKQRNWKYQDC